LWVANVAADKVDHDPDGGFIRNASMRVISETAAPRPGYRTDEPRPANSLSFHDPRILQVAVAGQLGRHGEGATDENYRGLKIGATAKAEGAEAKSDFALTFAPDGTSPLAIVLAAPASEDAGRWPDKAGEEIETPPLQLLVGEVRMSVQRRPGDPPRDDGIWAFLAADPSVQQTYDNQKYVRVLGSDVYAKALLPRGAPAADLRLDLVLTAEGIVFDALIADPFRRQSPPELIPVTLRIEPDDAGRMRLALVRERSAPGEPPKLRSVIDRLIAESRKADASILVDIAPGPVPLVWRFQGFRPLRLDNLHAPEILPGSVKATLLTEPLERGSLRSAAALAEPRARILTTAERKRRLSVEAGTRSGEARVQAWLATDWAGPPRRSRFTVHLGVDTDEAPLLGAGAAPKDVPVAVKVGRLARDLEKRYVEHGLRAPGDRRPLYAFIALERGVVQLPVALPPRDGQSADVPQAAPPRPESAARAAAPDPPRRQSLLRRLGRMVGIGREETAAVEDVRAEASPPPPTAALADAFVGLVRATIDGAQEGEARAQAAAIHLDAASHVTATIEFEDFAPARTEMRFGGAVGTLAGALWLAERTPSADEVIPTRDAGPIALRSIDLGFGAKADGSPSWPGSLSPIADAPPEALVLTADLDGQGEVVHWAPPTNAPVPLIGAMNMTRSAPNATAPSQTRDIVPVRYRRKDPRNPASVRITLESAGTMLPQATLTPFGEVTVEFGWPSLSGDAAPGDRKAVSLVAPTLPGVQFAAAARDVPAPALEPLLRFDLPVLGELFSPPPAAGRGPAAPTSGRDSAIVTALDLAALEAVWDESARRHALTRTQQDRVIAGSAAAPVTGLLEPYSWRAKLTIATLTRGGLPFGRYALASAAIPAESDFLDGEEALAERPRTFVRGAGFSLTAVDPGEGPGDRSTITGFAAAPYDRTLSLPGSGAGEALPGIADTRGFVVAREAAKTGDFLTRQTQLLDSSDSDGADRNGFRNFVTARTETVLALGGHEMELWFRDLPLQPGGASGNWSFEPESTPEAANGPDRGVFDREPLSRSVYEWRLFGRTAPGKYEIEIAPFRLRPLRLWSLAWDGSAVTSATIVFAVLLGAAGSGDPTDALGFDDAYRTDNPVAIRFTRSGDRLVAAEIFTAEIDPAKGLALSKPTDTAAEPRGVPLGFRLDTDLPYDRAGADARGSGSIVLDFEVEIAGGAFVPIARSARLEAMLFGVASRFASGSVGLDADGVVTTFKPTRAATGALALESVVVSVPAAAARGRRARLAVTGRLSLAPAGEMAGQAVLTLRGADGSASLAWFGASAPVDPSTLAVDHRLGTLRLGFGGLELENPPIRGLILDELKATGMLGVTFASRNAEAGGDEAYGRALGAAYFEIEASNEEGASLRHRIQLPAPAEGDGPGSTPILVTLPTVARVSTIGWPVGSVRPLLGDQPFPGEDRGHPLTVRLAPGLATLEHRVEIRIVDAPLPTRAIAAPGFVLASPWRFKALTEHSVKTADTNPVKWTTIDDVNVVDLRALSERLKDGGLGTVEHRRTYAFSARYKSARRTPVNEDPNIRSAGIVPTGEFGAIGQLVAAAAPGRGELVVLGSAASEVPVPAGATSGVALTLPWIAPLFAGADIAPLNAIPQAPASGTRQVKIAAFDVAAALPFRLDTARGRATLGFGTGSVSEVAAVLGTSFGAGALEATRSADRAFASNLYPAPPATDAPLFWRSLMALARLWFRTPPGREQLEAATLVTTAGGAPARLVAALRQADPPTPAAEAADLIVIGRNSVALLALPRPDARRLAEAPGGDFLHALGRMALTAMAEPLITVAATRAGEGPWHGAFHGLAAPVAFETPRGRLLRTMKRTIFASAALGWPVPPVRRFLRALRTGEEVVLQDPACGWAGRVRSLGGPIAAEPPEDVTAEGSTLAETSTFLVLGRRALFERRGGPAEASPADRALTPVPPRARSPIAAPIQIALHANRISPPGPAGGKEHFAALLPGRFETLSTGARPGILFMEYESLLTAVRGGPFDPSHQRFGRLAGHGPVVWRQGRAPRSTGLPRTADLDRSRRTFVGVNLVRPGAVDNPAAELRPFALRSGPAALFRYSDKSGRPVAIITTCQTPALGRLSADFDGAVELRFVRPREGDDPDETPLVEVLVGEGLLPPAGGDGDEPHGLSASLRLAGTVLDFATGEWWSEDDALADAIVLRLQASEGLEALRSVLASANADSLAELALKFARPRDAGSAGPSPFPLATGSDSRPLEPGPPRLLILAVAPIPPDRPWLPVTTATLAFGDAAYDRELAGPAKSRGGTIDPQWLLAADRHEYDLSATVHFAFGKPNPDFAKLDRLLDVPPFQEPPQEGRLMLSVRPKPAGRIQPPERRLWIRGVKREAGGEDAHLVESGKAYALPVGALEEKDGRPAILSAGERLVLTLKLDGEDPIALDLGLVEEPVIAPPAAIYALVTLDGPRAEDPATIALFASAPLPQQIEFPDLLADLVRGHVRRRALFVWRFAPRTPLSANQPCAGLVKFDRTGGGQIPSAREDLESAG
jgi:hypothetical protein